MQAKFMKEQTTFKGYSNYDFDDEQGTSRDLREGFLKKEGVTGDFERWSIIKMDKI